MSGAPSVTVVTITRGRPDLLARAIFSVNQQQYEGELVHHIIIDACTETVRELHSGKYDKFNLSTHYAARLLGESSGPSRLAYLRNMSSRQVKTSWMAFLDDDNEYEPSHIRSLMKEAFLTKADATYSWRKVFTAKGDPYIEALWPWAKTVEEAVDIYKNMEALQVVKRGANVYRDNAEAGVVDTSTWLLKTTLLNEYPIPEDYSLADWESVITEDDKMLRTFLNSGLSISSSRRATMHYYLGGYSNSFGLT